MNRISKLALLSFIILFALVYIWISNPLLAMILGSISLVPFMRNVFEIKGCHNRSLYLTLSAGVLIVGIISTCMWVFSQTPTLSKVIVGIAAGLLILSIFQSAFSSTSKWDDFRIH
jgi:hypothetical protein